MPKIDYLVPLTLSRRGLFALATGGRLAMAAVGSVSSAEWRRYSDPATELEVLRLTDPSFASGMAAMHLRQFTRHSDMLLYWSERDPGARQAFLFDLRNGGSKQLTEVKALDSSTLSLSPDERTFLFFDGGSLMEGMLATERTREIHSVPGGAMRSGFSVGTDGAAIFAERENGKSRIVSVLRQQTRRIVETDQEIGEVMARPRRSQILYRAGDRFWIVNTDGSGRRQLKTALGRSASALWIPSGRTFIYLHVPEDRKELVTLREYSPDDGADSLIAKTSQFASASPNGDASVFTGASSNLASEYVLILVRAARRELTLCEHRASDPAIVRPVFSPDSQNVLFVSDRHGKPAIYQVRVGRFVEETGGDTQ